MSNLLNTLAFTLMLPASDSAVTHFPVDQMIDRDVMAFHFHIEATDASGATVSLPSGLTMTLRFGANGSETVVRLTGTERDVVLPRPLGVRVDRAAGVEVRVSIAGPETEGLTLHLSIEHESVERYGSRIPVVASRAIYATADTGARGWDWTSPSDGRLLNLTGLSLGRVGVIELVDVVTQEVIWSTDLRGSVTNSPVSATLRMGVPVRAGRSYRVVARGVEMTAAADLAALVLPSAKGTSLGASVR
jgi:hypothetical protein